MFLLVSNRCLLLGHVIENKKSEKRKEKKRKEKKEITPLHGKVVLDYNRDDNHKAKKEVKR